jgi:hypothetical protein
MNVGYAGPNEKRKTQQFVPCSSSRPGYQAYCAVGSTASGARQWLEQYTKPRADPAALTQALRPSAADLKTIFDESVLAAMTKKGSDGAR